LAFEKKSLIREGEAFINPTKRGEKKKRDRESLYILSAER